MTSLSNSKWKVTNPATGEIIGELEETQNDQVLEFYTRARTAFQSWGKTNIEERLSYLRKLRLYIVEHLDEVAKVISQDTGKVQVEALTADILVVLDAIQHLEKHAKKSLQTRKMPTPLLLFGKKSYVEYKPRGVVLVISPWNYPFQLAMVPIIYALAAGNTVILKPSEVTPLVGKLIEDLFEKAGFPSDVVQVGHGGKEVGAAFTSGKPDYIFFTGSVRTGKIIQAQAAKDLIPTTLELGGKDPMIVFADANIDRAVKGALWGAFTNAGQVCMSVERLYVERSIYETFKEKLREEVKQLKVGFQDDSDIGSMTFPGQIDIVKSHVEEALGEGGELLTGSHPKDWNTEKGLFLQPMVVAGAKHHLKIIQDESFGPILPLIPFDTEGEVVQLANDTPFGLNASVWSSNLDRAKRVASQLISGNVVINDVIITVANPYLPFGGAKESGIGRYHGDIGLEIFTHQTAVMVDSGKKKTEVNWYPYKGKYPLFKQLIEGYFGGKRDWVRFVKSYLGLLRR